MNQHTDSHASPIFADGLLMAIFGPLHNGYLRAITLFADYPAPGQSAAMPLEFSKVDAAANRSGTIYRGLGIGVGLLSIVILWLAVIPVALGVTDGVVLARLKTAKVALMTAVVLAVAMAAFGPWRRRWTALRKQAQMLACKPHPVPGEASACAASMRSDLRRLLDEQIAYNAITSGKYHDIERNTMFLTYSCFAIAFVCAAADALFFALAGHSPKLLLIGTILLPGVVGILHGINGFLRVGEQAFSCKLMENHLIQLRAALDRLLEQGNAPPEEALADVGKEIADILARYDNLWAATVRLPPV